MGSLAGIVWKFNPCKRECGSTCMNKEVNQMGGYGGTGDQDDLDNHSDQCNPNNDEYDGYQED